MNELLELEFKGRRTEYAANPLQYPFQRGDLAVVSTDRGQDLGKVAFVGLRTGDPPGEKPGLVVVRKAKTADVDKLRANREREAEAKRVARVEILRHNLDMKLVDVELQWDGRKMTFFFTAEGRVDFRDLVRDLATRFRTRIDLRQIGARDETKKISGYGVCGRALCCATFLTEFKPITTQMPRDQFLPLNPSKLSGVCGRLKCCLRYELDIYRDFQRECPKVGHPIKDEDKGMGEVDKLDVVREQIQVRYGNGTLDRYTKEQFVELTNWRPQMPKNECICTCGKKGGSPELPQAQSATATPAPTSDGLRGNRITLRAEGGFRVDFEDDDEQSLDVSTDVSVTMDSPSKRKRKKKKKRPADGAPTGEAAAQSGPPAQERPPRPPQAQQQQARPPQQPQARPPQPQQPPRQPRPQSEPTQQAAPAPGTEGQPARKKRRRGGRRRHAGEGGAASSESGGGSDAGDDE
ncbi:MAG: hypothetical protein IPK53_15175 [bacterium]|nr:hypothetical protein [bacterium]MBK8130181.1 hypothetical protein [bacterium]